jgi:hypothetical protein
MKAYFFLLPTLLLFAAAHSQNTLSARDRNLKQTLGMTAQDYKVFAKAMQDYQQKILAVQKDNTLSFEAKKKALESLHQQKQQYIGSHLTQDQQDKLKTYSKTNERYSQAYLKRQQQTEILKQKAVKQNAPQ